MNSFPEINPAFALSIPYARKDELKKQHKLLWGPNTKLWYARNQKSYDSCELVPYHIVNLVVAYKHKDDAKELGAKWNGSNWYCSKSQFEKHKSKFNSFATDSDDEDEQDDTYLSLDKFKKSEL